VGAGDSTLAGFIYALTKKKSFRESLILAAAVGTAAVMNPGTALCKKRDVERIKKEIRIEAR
jgi:6-phosphofructokinase 2